MGILAEGILALADTPLVRYHSESTGPTFFTYLLYTGARSLQYSVNATVRGINQMMVHISVK